MRLQLNLCRMVIVGRYMSFVPPLSSIPPKSVISTEGALLRRSGEIPVLALAVASEVLRQIIRIERRQLTTQRSNIGSIRRNRTEHPIDIRLIRCIRLNRQQLILIRQLDRLQ